jgi:hypothetical protein
LAVHNVGGVFVGWGAGQIDGDQQDGKEDGRDLAVEGPAKV